MSARDDSFSLAALKRVGQRVVREREMIRSGLKDEIDLLHAAGVSSAILAVALTERGLDQAQIEEFDIAALWDDDEPVPLILNTHCLKTCTGKKLMTVVITLMVDFNQDPPS